MSAVAPLQAPGGAGAAAPAGPRAATGAHWHYGLGLVLCVLVGFVAYQFVLAAQLRVEKATSARRLEFFSLSLEALLNRNEALPGLLALERKLAARLDGEAGAGEAANHYLEAVAQAARLSAAYLMDADGLTVAASNWNQPLTFMGENYGFRPYVQEALAGRVGRFFGIGATSGEAGYFLASRLQGAGGAPGVIAIKLALDPLEEALRQSGDAVLVVDREGVVILGSVPEWKYRVLEPLAAATRERLTRTRQYGNEPLPTLSPTQAVGPARTQVRLERAGARADYSIARRPVGNLGWRMMIFTDQRASREVALLAALAATALTACVVGLYFHVRLTRGRREDRRRAEAELQRVSASLEERIGRRTADLTEANSALEEKVAQLKRAEAMLRETRDSAVQAGKLAVLGQMSAGMTHELNQPLAALHTLSDNAVTLIGQDRVAEARENLLLISQVAARMGRIVTQLKSFARKEPTALAPVRVDEAIAHALMIVESRRRESGATVQVGALPEALRVMADAVRLEQVLVNLLRNGLDAVAGTRAPALHVTAWHEGGAVRISIRDCGPGIAPQTLARLFEPFHTTKPVGEGLGLGLALSLAIVESFGGRLQGRNLPEGGAEFSVILEAA